MKSDGAGETVMGTTLEEVANDEILRGALYAAVRLAITRHDIELEADTATAEEIAEDAAGACFGEECCDEIPIPEVTEILRRMKSVALAPAGVKAAARECHDSFYKAQGSTHANIKECHICTDIEEIIARHAAQEGK